MERPGWSADLLEATQCIRRVQVAWVLDVILQTGNVHHSGGWVGEGVRINTSQWFGAKLPYNKYVSYHLKES